MNLKKWHRYGINYLEQNDSTMTTMHYPHYDILETHRLSVKKSWTYLKKKQPVLAAVLIRMFGEAAPEAHILLKLNISEIEAAEMLTTLEEFKDNTYLRLQKSFMFTKE